MSGRCRRPCPVCALQPSTPPPLLPDLAVDQHPPPVLVRPHPLPEAAQLDGQPYHDRRRPGTQAQGRRVGPPVEPCALRGAGRPHQHAAPHHSGPTVSGLGTEPRVRARTCRQVGACAARPGRSRPFPGPTDPFDLLTPARYGCPAVAPPRPHLWLPLGRRVGSGNWFAAPRPSARRRLRRARHPRPAVRTHPRPRYHCQRPARAPGGRPDPATRLHPPPAGPGAEAGVGQGGRREGAWAEGGTGPSLQPVPAPTTPFSPLLACRTSPSKPP